MFRGKRIDNDGWVEGDLIQSKSNKVDGKNSAWIMIKSIYPFGAISTPSDRFIQVESATVGEFTGLLDKKGLEIFEGDVVQKDFDAFVIKKELAIFNQVYYY